MTNHNQSDSSDSVQMPSEEPPAKVSEELAREIKWVEIAQIASNLGLFIVGIIALCIYSGQLSEMRKSTKAALDAADAAKSAAQTAVKTLESSSNSFKQEQRAYVATTQAMMSTPPLCQFPGGIRVCVDVHLANSGKTPAIGVRIHRYATFGQRAEEVVKNMKVPAYVFPDGGMLGNVGDQWGTAATDSVDAQTASKLVKAEMPVYIYGVIQYFDIFREYHETGFCYHRVYHGDAFIGCEHGNWFDKRYEN